MKADSLRDCADRVRERGKEREFLILALDYWKDFRRYFKFAFKRRYNERWFEVGAPARERNGVDPDHAVDPSLVI